MFKNFSLVGRNLKCNKIFLLIDIIHDSEFKKTVC